VRLQLGGDPLPGLGGGQAGDAAGVDADPFAGEGAGRRLAVGGADDRPDRKPELRGELAVALVWAGTAMIAPVP